MALKPGAVAGMSGRLVPRLQELASPSVARASTAVQGVRMSLPVTGPGSLIRIGGQVVVTARMSSTAPSDVQALRSAGAQVMTVSDRYAMITFAVAPADLEKVAAVSSVRSIQPELQPLTSGAGDVGGAAAAAATVTCPSGSVRSEGDTQLRAADARAQFGVDGSGVKVGIISDSFDTNTGAATHAAADVASGDLPGAGNPCGFTTPVQDLQDSTGEDEGRAMAQVVHDLAPGASLAFASDATSTGFPSAISALRTAGANVIVDDLTVLNEPFFQDGPDAVAANQAAAAGIPYFSSAGNLNVVVSGNNVASWEAPSYRPTACPNVTALSGYLDCMDFDPGAGTSNTESITLAPRGQFTLDLQWNEPWFGVRTDLDVAVLDSSGNVLAASVNANTGADGTQMPFEAFSYTNPSTTANQTVSLVIARFPSVNPGTPRLKYVLAQTQGLLGIQFPNSSSGDIVGPAIFGHNGTSGVMSVAAVPFNNSAQVEPFSSRGPVTLYYGPVNGTTPAAALPSPEVLSKPDVAATDGAATTFFDQMIGGVWRFFGTSEAAPHAAAIAALELQSDPVATVDQVDSAERSTASAVGSAGSDAAGQGLLNAVGAVGTTEALLSPPVAAFMFTPSSPVEGGSVSFDGSGSSDLNPGGAIADYSWSFGDGGSGSGASVSHTYATPGAYTVTLTVTDNYGRTSSSSQTVDVIDEPPTAAFTPPSGFAGMPIAFSGSGSDPDGTITGFSWSFGDGGSGSGADVSHTYAAPGTYTVTLTVSDSDGQTGSVSHQVTVAGPPVASFTFSPSSPIAGGSVAFDGSGSSDPNSGGQITGYSWNFGDGAIGSGATVSHVYSIAGTYAVTLTVTDSFGQAGSVSHRVSVGAPAPPPPPPLAPPPVAAPPPPLAPPPVAAPAPPLAPSPIKCLVPHAIGKSLSAARSAIRLGHCTVGKVRGPGHKPKHRLGKHKKWLAVVTREVPVPGAEHAAGTKISLTLVWKARKR